MKPEDKTTVANEGEAPAAPAAEAAPPQPQSVPESGTPANPVAVLEQKVNEYMIGWQRERADFNNYKKRAETALRESQTNGAIDTLTSLIPVIDDLERAMAHIPIELAENPWVNGVGGIHRKFIKILEERGISVVDPVGQPFSPAVHEAVMSEPSTEVESGHVIATLQKGYSYGDRVLRPALVKVAQ